jgi:hypothetical protein
MYEIIANPEDYRIGALKEGLGYKQVAFPDDERKRWAEEIGIFAVRLDGLSDKAKQLQKLFISEETIMVSPASLKTFKVQLYKINDALDIALDLAGKIESEIVKK